MGLKYSVNLKIRYKITMLHLNMNNKAIYENDNWGVEPLILPLLSDWILLYLILHNEQYQRTYRNIYIYIFCN